MKPFRNLRHLMDDQDYRQVDMATAACISTSALNERLTGKQPFNAWEMMRIGDVLGLKPEQYCDYFFPRAKDKDRAVKP